MHVAAGEPEIIIAEFAGHDDVVVNRHVIQVLGGEALQNARQPRARTAASKRQGSGAIHRDAFAVQQAVQQPFGRKIVVEQFPIRQRCGQRGGGVPAFILRRLVQRRVDAAGAGNFLQDQRAGAPAGSGLRTGQTDLAAQLLAGVEVVQCHFRQRTALDGDDTLVAVLLAALIDGEREISPPEQRLGRGGRVARQQRRQFVAVGDGMAAQFAGVGAVGEQHGHRPVALRLQAERAAKFERGGQTCGERQRLPDKFGDHRVVVMPRQQRLGERAEADKPPTHRAVGQEEWQDAARHDEVGHRWTAAIEEGWCIGHRAKISAQAVRCYPGGATASATGRKGASGSAACRSFLGCTGAGGQRPEPSIGSPQSGPDPALRGNGCSFVPGSFLRP